jgi:hypothetical protein
MSEEEAQQFIRETIEKIVTSKISYEVSPSLMPDREGVAITLSFDDHHTRFLIHYEILSVADNSAAYIDYAVRSAVYRLTESYFLKQDVT